MSVAAPTGFETIRSVEKLSHMIIAYFRAYAQDKTRNQVPSDKTILVRPQGKLLRRRIHVWLVEPTMWYVVDEDGHGYERSGTSEYAKALSYDYLYRQPVEKLHAILSDFDPWRNAK